MGLDINITANPNSDDYDSMDWSFSGRSKWGFFVTYMEHEFDYVCAKNMPLTIKTIDKMIDELLYYCKEIDIEDVYELHSYIRMIEALLDCRGIIKSGGKATWEADW